MRFNGSGFRAQGSGLRAKEQNPTRDLKTARLQDRKTARPD
jgi:hypothetical protein